MKKILICLTILLLLSCDREWLDIKPKGFIIPYKTEDYRLLLDQVERGSAITGGFKYGYSNPDLMSDDFIITDDITNLFSQERINEYKWKDNIFRADEEDPDWKNLYSQIYVANLVIEEIMSAKGSKAEKKELLAEAKLQRAYAYFCLVNLYAVHYNKATADSNPAVPLRLTSKIEGPTLKRASVKEVYDQILEDAADVVISDLPDMPESIKLRIRPSKASAYGFLARVYLYRGKYNQAKDYANKSLQIAGNLIDYNTLSQNKGQLIFPNSYKAQNVETLWFKTANPYVILIPSQELFNSYEASDLRLKKYSTLNTAFGLSSTSLVLLTSYYIHERLVGLTTAEVYLTRAECNARSGNIDEAMNDVNKVRINRIKKGEYLPLRANSKEEALKIVKAERRREFVGSGLRYFDLKRYNQFDNENITLKRNLSGKTYTLKPNSKNWAIPVAQKYILKSPELGANDRD